MSRATAAIALAIAFAGCKSAPEEPTSNAHATATTIASPAPPPAAAAPSAPVLSRDDLAFLGAMNDFCVITQQVGDDPKIARKDRATTIVKRLVAKSPPPSFLAMLQGLADVPSGDQYAALRKAAAEHGAKNWSCPALDAK